MLKKIRDNKVIKIIGNILYALAFILVLLILIVVAIQRFSNNDIAIFGIRFFYVASGSMLPQYGVGDILISQETDPENINVGDAITYLGNKGSMNGMIVTHQVVEKNMTEDGKYTFVTKGTANTIVDPAVSEDQVYGKVLGKSQILSFICKLLQNIYGFYFIIIVPLGIILAKFIFNFLVSREEKKSSMEEDDNLEDSEEDINEETIEESNNEDKDKENNKSKEKDKHKEKEENAKTNKSLMKYFTKLKSKKSSKNKKDDDKSEEEKNITKGNDSEESENGKD